MFQFHTYDGVDFGTINNVQDMTWLLSTIGIQFLVIAGFIVMLLILLIANVIRVGYLWMVI